MSTAETAAPVFHIGFADTGGAWLAELFRANGYEARLGEGGALAEDIAAAEATGAAPLAGWPGARLFADLGFAAPPPNPPLEAFRSFRFLDAAFPGAAFVLTSRDLDDWIALRFAADGGLHRGKEALRLGLAEAELPALWRREWEAHIAEVSAYFAGDARLIRFDFDHGRAEDLARALRPWVALTALTPPHPWPDARRRGRLHAALKARCAAPAARRALAREPGDGEMAEAIARHCLGQVQLRGGAWPRARRSHVYGHWRGGGEVLDRKGETLPLVLSDRRFVRSARAPKLDRIQAALNEMLDLGATGPVVLDMQDARRFGVDGAPSPPRPLVAYNRRAGAENLVLWPLVGYHSPGGRFYVSGEDRDTLCFDAKDDKAVWRGNLTGLSAPGHGPKPGGRPARSIYADLARAPAAGPDRAALIDELTSIPRVAAALRYAGHPDLDLMLTPGAQHAMARRLPELAGAIGESKPVSWFYRHRYIISLAGNDTGSNFLMAANSNALVLKEEDGWELFYTGLFRPWEHYLPLAPGGADLEDKLDWARTHPAEAREMAGAARALCRRLAHPATRAAALSRVLAGLGAL